MIYLNSKAVGRGNKKIKALRAMTHADWLLVLDEVEMSATRDANTNWQRDYALIYLAAKLGMRRGEIILFRRQHFRLQRHTPRRAALRADMQRQGVFGRVATHLFSLRHRR